LFQPFEAFQLIQPFQPFEAFQLIQPFQPFEAFQLIQPFQLIQSFQPFELFQLIQPFQLDRISWNGPTSPTGRTSRLLQWIKELERIYPLDISVDFPLLLSKLHPLKK